jgi:predicted DNA-binding transcriptional regulator AlpA
VKETQMNENNPTPSDDRLVSPEYLAERIGISPRDLSRKIPKWHGFPKPHKLGHRTIRFSLHEFNCWLDALKSGGNSPT